VNLYQVTFQINRSAKPVSVKVEADGEEEAREKSESKIFAQLDLETLEDMNYDPDDQIWTITPVSEAEQLRMMGAQPLPGFEEA
jgi:hypothetical protein